MKGCSVMPISLTRAKTTGAWPLMEALTLCVCTLNVSLRERMPPRNLTGPQKEGRAVCNEPPETVEVDRKERLIGVSAIGAIGTTNTEWAGCTFAGSAWSQNSVTPCGVMVAALAVNASSTWRRAERPRPAQSVVARTAHWGNVRRRRRRSSGRASHGPTTGPRLLRRSWTWDYHKKWTDEWGPVRVSDRLRVPAAFAFGDHLSDACLLVSRASVVTMTSGIAGREAKSSRTRAPGLQTRSTLADDRRYRR